MTKPMCYLCLTTTDEHWPECRATQEKFNPTRSGGRAWRLGVEACRKVNEPVRALLSETRHLFHSANCKLWDRADAESFRSADCTCTPSEWNRRVDVALEGTVYINMRELAIIELRKRIEEADQASAELPEAITAAIRIIEAARDVVGLSK